VTAKVFVHIGPHKSGTTFLQQVLAANKAALAANGVLFPGRSYSRQRRALEKLLRSSGGKSRQAGPWRALAREVARWQGDIAVLSNESIGTAGLPPISMLVESLAPAEVHVVYTARDFTKVIPAMWHTQMRNQQTKSWETYLRTVRGDPAALSAWGRRIWSAQDPREVFGRWEQLVPRTHIHVVTVPPSGTAPDVLWERFCAAIGMDPAPYSLEVRRLNESLGTAEVEVLRRINARVEGRISKSGYNRWIQVFAARRVLEHRPEQTKFALPVEEHGWIRTRAEEIIRFLEEGGYSVTGDLHDLMPAPVSATAVRPDEVDLEQALDAAVDVIAGLLETLDEKATRARSGGRGVPPAPGRAAAATVIRRVRSSVAARLGRSSGPLARWHRRR